MYVQAVGEGGEDAGAVLIEDDTDRCGQCNAPRHWHDTQGCPTKPYTVHPRRLRVYREQTGEFCANCGSQRAYHVGPHEVCPDVMGAVE
jgi:hypothetical protein